MESTQVVLSSCSSINSSVSSFIGNSCQSVIGLPSTSLFCSSLQSSWRLLVVWIAVCLLLTLPSDFVHAQILSYIKEPVIDSQSLVLLIAPVRRQTFYEFSLPSKGRMAQCVFIVKFVVTPVSLRQLTNV